MIQGQYSIKMFHHNEFFSRSNFHNESHKLPGNRERVSIFSSSSFKNLTTRDPPNKEKRMSAFAVDKRRMKALLEKNWMQFARNYG